MGRGQRRTGAISSTDQFWLDDSIDPLVLQPYLVLYDSGRGCGGRGRSCCHLVLLLVAVAGDNTAARRTGELYLLLLMLLLLELLILLLLQLDLLVKSYLVELMRLSGVLRR